MSPGSVQVEVRLFAFLARYLPPGADGRRALLSVPVGTTVQQVLEQLGIPRGYSKLLLVGGLQEKPDTVLRDGDVLSVFPPVAGGACACLATQPGGAPHACQGAP
ncbi:MAG: MoaD/ThiS family protein [Candidatus Latescibacterota bacterium]